MCTQGQNPGLYLNLESRGYKVQRFLQKSLLFILCSISKRVNTIIGTPIYYDDIAISTTYNLQAVPVGLKISTTSALRRKMRRKPRRKQLHHVKKWVVF